MEKIDPKRTQLIIVVAIFLLFTTGAFITSSYLLPWLLIPLIIANTALLFINKEKGLSTNIMLFSLTLLMRVFIIEYFAAMLGMAISGLYALKVGLRYRRGEIGAVAEKKKKEKQPQHKA